VELGELAADRRRAVGGELSQGPERLGQPAGRFEGDQGVGGLQDPLELAGPAREEPLEPEAVGGQSGDDQR
jgi:hypothetical protein